MIKNIITFLLLVFVLPANASNYYVDPSIGSDNNTFVQAQSQSTPWATVGKVNGVLGTNLITYPENLENTLWKQYDTKHVSTDTTTAPDGIVSADTVTADPVAYGGYFKWSHSFSNVEYTWSFYVKKINHSYVGISFKNIGVVSDVSLFFNLDTQTWGNTGYATTYSAESVGDGWYRLSITGTPSAGTAYANIGICKSNGSLVTAPAGTEQVYIWGAKLTTGALTPYKIFPGDSVLFKKGSNFAETLMVDFRNFGTSGNPIIYGSYGTGANPTMVGISGNGLGDYVTIDGIDATGTGGISILGFNNLGIKNLKSSGATSNGIIVDENTAGGAARQPINTTIDNVEANNNGNRGMWLESTGAVSRFTAHDNAQNAISSSPGTIGGVLTFSDIELYDNAVHGFATSASIANTTINIYRMKSYRNLSGYFSHAQISAITNIYYSLIYDNTDGIQVGTNADPYGDTNIYNSTIVDNENNGILVNQTSDIILKNSIVHGNGVASGYNLNWLPTGGTVVSDYNIITQNSEGRSIYVSRDAAAKTLAQWQALDEGIYDQHSKSDDPQFVDAASGNYRLQSTSPAINAGTRD